MKDKNVDSRSQFNFEAAAIQRDRLLYELRLKDVSTVDARIMGIMSPAARILELRRKGHEIETRKSEVATTQGAITCVALYHLLNEHKEDINGEKVMNGQA